MAKKRIFVDKNGDLITLHDDKFERIADHYGTKTIHRASDVEFNNTLDLWEIRVPSGGRVVGWANTREEALRFEKIYVEQEYTNRLENSCPVHSSP